MSNWRDKGCRERERERGRERERKRGMEGRLQRSHIHNSPSHTFSRAVSHSASSIGSIVENSLLRQGTALPTRRVEFPFYFWARLVWSSEINSCPSAACCAFLARGQTDKRQKGRRAESVCAFCVQTTTKEKERPRMDGWADGVGWEGRMGRGSLTGTTWFRPEEKATTQVNR